MPRLNVEGAVRAYLEGRMPGTRVSVSVPEDRPQTLVVVRRNGGRRVNALLDRAGLDVLCWAPTESEACALAERASDLVLALGSGHILEGFDRVDEESLRSDYDRQARSPRWYGSYTITTHKY